MRKFYVQEAIMIHPEHDHPIFISHSSRDREAADRLVKDLERRGIPCWISSRDIGPGDDYQGAIVTALEAAPAMLLLFSMNANNSREIPRELSLASTRRKPMIPVRLEDIVPSGALEYQLTNAQFIDLFQNYNEAMERLCLALRRQIKAASEGDGEGLATPNASYVRLQSRMPGRRGVLMGSAAAVFIAVAAGAAFIWQHNPTTQVQSASLSSPRDIEAVPAKLAPSPSTHQAEAVGDPSPKPEHQPQRSTVSDLSDSQTTVSSVAPSQPAVQIAPPAASMSLPEATPMPASPELPHLPEAAKGDIGSGPLAHLVAQLSAIAPSARENLLGQAFSMHDEKLSGEQVIALLGGITEGSRYNKVHDLIDHIQSPLTVSQALGILNASGNTRVGMIQQLVPLLPASLSGPDMVALLGRLSEGDRYNGLSALIHNVSGPVDTASAFAIVRPSGNSWVGVLQLMAPVLAHPMQVSDVILLLGRTESGDRYNAVNALLSNIPDTVSTENALAVLRGSENSYVGVLQLLAPHLPDALTVPQFTALLGKTTSGDRYNAISAIVTHLQDHVKGTELEGALRLLGNSWVGGVQLLAGHLASPQDGPAISVLLGTLSEGDRYNAVQAITPVLPDHLSFDEVAMILHGTGNAQVGVIQLIAGHCTQLSEAQRLALLSGLSSNERANGLRAFGQSN